MKVQGPGRWHNFIRNRRWPSLLHYFAFACVLFGVKLCLINYYGNATPFWDQWDGEADNLYKPLSDGTLGWNNLLLPHNEHRIFTMRILALGILGINNTWNPLLQMVINAGLHIIVIVFCIFLLTRVVGRHHLPALLVFSLVLFSIPYGWENTLVGFQSQFYLVLLFSIPCLWLTLVGEPLSLKWWVGVAFALFAFFSLASGIFALAATAFTGLLFYFNGLRRTNKQLIAVAILAGLFALGAYLTPSLPHHVALKASSFGQFFRALTRILGWPVLWGLPTAILRNLPALFFVGWMLWKRPSVKDPRWFLLALVVWSAGQAVSVAYGRAIGHLSSRYLDLFAIGILVNFACLLSVAQNPIQKWRKRSIAWTAVVLVSLGIYGAKLPREMAHKRDSSRLQEINTKNYLATGNLIHLKDKPLYTIPYPDANRLAMILSWPEIRKILPVNIGFNLPVTSVDSKPAQVFVVNGYRPTTPARVDSTWGSFNAQGDRAVGELLIRFDNQPGGRIEIPVAGYPMNSGNKIEIEQNGQRKAITLKENPKDNWAIAYAKVSPGPFSLCLTDSSKTSWLVAGAPSLQGRFDRFTNCLLSHYYLFVLLGVVIWILVRKKVLKNRPDQPMESREESDFADPIN